MPTTATMIAAVQSVTVIPKCGAMKPITRTPRGIGANDAAMS